MNYLHRLAWIAVAALASGACAAEPRELFNGRDLTGWDSYLGPRYDAAKKDFAGEPVGLNRDPDGVFSVVTTDGAPAIRISGEVFGGIVTHDEFENYHLRVQFKWGEKRFPPRTTSLRDSGVLYHSVGPHATGWFFWMRSQEFQVQEHDTGDYWAVGGASIRSEVQMRDVAGKPAWFYSPAGALEVFRSGAKAGGRIRKAVDAESEFGQWNTLDLYCVGGTSMHVVNGVLVTVLCDSEQPDGAGGFIPLTKGKIQLQSEGAEVFYRAVTIEPIDRFPDLAMHVPGAPATAK